MDDGFSDLPMEAAKTAFPYFHSIPPATDLSGSFGFIDSKGQSGRAACTAAGPFVKSPLVPSPTPFAASRATWLIG